MDNQKIVIAGQSIEPGTITIINLPVAELYTQAEVSIPIHVFHGRKNGPKLFVTSAIHGDEINSIEILRRLCLKKSLKKIYGTLIIIPIVNVHGFILQSRYLPDRRDLNRSFPGSKTGSLASRIAHTLMEEIISKCDYGIDLHTGAYGRMNMPQIRVNLETPGSKKLAIAFDVPVILDSKVRDGSLRGAASELGIPLLVYEGGEALRFNEMCVRAGFRGILKVLNYLGMIALPEKRSKSRYKPIITQTSRWVRAPISGLMQSYKDISDIVHKNDLLARIHDPFLINTSQLVFAPFNGIIIGHTNLPLINEGNAMYNIASIKKLRKLEAYIEEIRDVINQDLE